MSLSDWEKNDWLKAHKTSDQEIEGLLSIVARELKDAQVKGISSDGKFSHAYRAALTLGTVLLYKSGYALARGQSHHHRTIEAIPEILGGVAKDDATTSSNAGLSETPLNMTPRTKRQKRRRRSCWSSPSSFIK